MSIVVAILGVIALALFICAPMLWVAHGAYQRNRCARCGKSSGDGPYDDWCAYCCARKP